MATKKELIDELNFLTELLSNRIRTISIGILAFCWLFIFNNISGQNTPHLIENQILLVPVFLAISALVADFAQYWFGFVNTRSILRNKEEKGLDISYDYYSLSYRLRTIMFYAKQVLVLAASVWLLVVLGIKIMQ
jgi:hypothetical protein